LLFNPGIALDSSSAVRPFSWGSNMHATLNQIDFQHVASPTRHRYLPFFVKCFREEYEELLLERTNGMLRNLEISQLDLILPAKHQNMIEAVDKNDQVLGTVVFSEIGTECYVWGLYVLREFQRLGLGRKLMQEVCQRITPATTLEVQVLKQSLKAQNFYKKLGFQTYQTCEEEVFPSINLQVDFMQCSRDLCVEKLSDANT
jgi:ribosomal protein S18 acetylase RimI-like enzyme